VGLWRFNTRIGPCRGTEHKYQHPFLAVSSSARGFTAADFSVRISTGSGFCACGGSRTAPRAPSGWILDCWLDSADTAAMGLRTRGLDIVINAKRQVADAAARAEAKGVVERWNEQLAASRDMLWSPTIRAALIAGTPWLDVFCPGCGTSQAIDLRKVDRHPLDKCFSVGAYQ
jgi:hypothetical protein